MSKPNDVKQGPQKKRKGFFGPKSGNKNKKQKTQTEPQTEPNQQKQKTIEEKRLQRKLTNQAKQTRWAGIQFKPLEEVAEFFWNLYLETLKKVLTPEERLDPLTSSSFVKPEKPEWTYESDLVPFLQETNSTLLNTKPPPGSPTILILCQSAYRCIQIEKILKNSLRQSKVCTIFSKHKKLLEQANQVRSKVFHVAVAAPARALQLVKSESLSLLGCQLLIVDMWRDQKTWNMLESKQVRIFFFEFFRESLLSLVKEDKMKICLF